jgi:hypothetical protein
VVDLMTAEFILLPPGKKSGSLDFVFFHSSKLIGFLWLSCFPIGRWQELRKTGKKNHN